MFILFLPLFQSPQPVSRIEAQPSPDVNRGLLELISRENGVGGPNTVSSRLNLADSFDVTGRPESDIAGEEEVRVTEEEAEEEMVEDSFEELEIPITNSSIQPPIVGTEANVSSSNETVSGDVATPIFAPVIDDIPFIISNETSLNASETLPPRNITYVSETLDSIPKNTTFMVGEPATAANKKTVFYTGNLYSARSLDSGKSWQYISPKNDFPNVCCDQDVIFDPKHNLFVWSRQSHKNDTTAENTLRLAISKDTSNWVSYDIRPVLLNPTWKGKWLDNPSLAVGDRFLYVTVNLFPINVSEGSPVPPIAVIVRISMDDLSEYKPTAFSFYASPNKFFFTPVQGASNRMFWATHISNEIIRIYEWNESDSWQKIKWKDVSIPSWSHLLQNNHECGIQTLSGGPRSGNWCGHADSRITSGWIIDDKIGFFWNAAGRTLTRYGTIFPYPYVNAAVFDLSNNTNYVGRPYIWNSHYPILYAYSSPNRNGELGVIVYYGDGVQIPPSLSFSVLENNKFNESATWNSVPLVNSTHSPQVDIDREEGRLLISYEWGDYIRARPYFGPDYLWVASGYVLEGGSTDENVKPYYFKIK